MLTGKKFRCQTLENDHFPPLPFRKGGQPFRKGSLYSLSPSLIFIPRCARAAVPSLSPSFTISSRQIAGVYSGFKRNKLNKIARAKASGSRGKRDAHPEPEPDEVNDLLANDQYEGDPELEYETEPLFNVTDLMRIAITREHNNLWSKEGEKGGSEDGKGEAMEE
ncbi:hypothetical protein PRIPAC_92615 [Pristionchus pacificus]|uniref:Uncharacterized protein n=1 Tax=Pristionchus pacificus TaxID=54126 RepID=A0A2A6CI54_PRIPA|nr:hypothetical protein PRIPAC_92615 [Pristionchus pacificus]|eukprot:PDM77701.1 hypothetical protein PRIPAC_34568 [Pristionchus pacificus]